MLRPILILLGLLLSACGGASQPSQTLPGDRPLRIVSLDYCSDQYVLKLADPDQILALSPDAQSDFSYMRQAAASLPTVRPVAEDVLALRPDLVVRAYGGGPRAVGFFERADIPVLQVGWTSSLEGNEPGSISATIQHMADGLGHPDRGMTLIDDFQARLARIAPRQNAKAALYMTPAGATTGPGSLIHEMLVAAGLENFQERQGWHPLPLERLAYDRPDVVAAAFYTNAANTPDGWSSSRHPIARAQLDGPEVVGLDGAWTACGAWFILDAVEALALANGVN